MASCLGLYIEENIIKYAKVSKENDVVKVESFGIKFYDKLNDAIEKIIEETYSYNTPISINTTNENYNYFYIFNLLNKKDMHNYIMTEFESLCYEKTQNVDTFDTRYILTNDLEDKEKLKAIHVSVNKTEVTKKNDLFAKHKLVSISPVALNLSNLLEFNKNKKVENVAIVNIEDKTTVTSIIDQKIYEVKTINEGTSEILNKIDEKENSYSKAYEICKNSTIYTTSGKDVQYEENAYLDDIMPTLYNIVGQVKKILNDSIKKIDKVYITGTASVINNIDIYFQEYLEDVKCEILRPYFIKAIGTHINIKDYIEVNSAIALALQGLGDGIKGINFKKEGISNKIPSWLTKDIGGSSKKEKKTSFNIGFDLTGSLSSLEKGMIRTAIGVLMLIIVYGAFAGTIKTQIEEKSKEVSEAEANLNAQLSAISSDKTKMDKKTQEYTELMAKLEERNAINTEDKKFKYAVPTLLNEIMYVIPVNVQLTSIVNTGTRVTIVAQTDKYEQLGFFTEKLKQDGILTNVVSDFSQKQDNVVTTVIEGDLP